MEWVSRAPDLVLELSLDLDNGPWDLLYREPTGLRNGLCDTPTKIEAPKSGKRGRIGVAQGGEERVFAGGNATRLICHVYQRLPVSDNV